MKWGGGVHWHPLSAEFSNTRHGNARFKPWRCLTTVRTGRVSYRGPHQDIKCVGKPEATSGSSALIVWTEVLRDQGRVWIPARGQSFSKR
ncbi:hypothetical protein NL676_018542 [Syzygium grande]|nr:hypothetical protein NL676_018542 [Syzygium grande]